MISDGTTTALYKSLGDAYLEVCQQQRDAVTDDDKDRWNLEEKDSRRTVDAIRAYDRSKDASRDATYDTDEGKKEKGDKEKKYAKKERDEIKKDDPNWKNKKYHTGMHGEEYIPEIYKGRHGQSEKEYQDSRSDAGKMISGDSQGSGANYSYKAKNTGTNPAGGSVKPQGQARMGRKDREYLAYRKANAKKESYRGMTVGEILAEGGMEKASSAMDGINKVGDGIKKAVQTSTDIQDTLLRKNKKK